MANQPETKMADALKQCDQRQRKLPLDRFLRVKAGWECTKCDDCAQSNMRVWAYGWDPVLGIIPATLDTKADCRNNQRSYE